MTNFVIFGASGDLAQNYLFPSLFNLWKKGHKFNYVGFARTQMSDSDFQALILKSTGSQEFASLFRYVSGNYEADGLKNLRPLVTPDTIYYSALPTRLDVITPLVSGLIEQKIFDPKKSHLVIEKPFGTDHASAKQIMDFLEKSVGSESVFLVDHYLTKELVRNLLTLRFSNPIFNNLWNQNFIKEINIIATETRGIDARGEYYDQTGAIRDMIQNHCLQLVALTTMDQFSEKVTIFKNLVAKNIKIGQYEGYLNETGVAKNSTTETFAEIKFKLDLPKWTNVPITVIAAKKMDKKITEINIVFKNDSKQIPNQLTINLSPDNDIVLTINLPKPVQLRLGSLVANSSYENVILDVVSSNHLNSPSFDEILAQWQIVDKILSKPRLRDQLFCY